MKRALITMITLLTLQSIAVTKEITLVDRVIHPVATVKHSFAWVLDPFNMIPTLNGGIADPRGNDSINYKKYITGETDNYYLREPK